MPKRTDPILHRVSMLGDWVVTLGILEVQLTSKPELHLLIKIQAPRLRKH